MIERKELNVSLTPKLVQLLRGRAAGAGCDRNGPPAL